MSALDFEKMSGQEIQEKLSACLKKAEEKLEELRQETKIFKAQMDIFMLTEELISAGFRIENVTIILLNMQGGGESRSEPLQHVSVAVDAGKGHGWVSAVIN